MKDDITYGSGLLKKMKDIQKRFREYSNLINELSQYINRQIDPTDLELKYITVGHVNNIRQSLINTDLRQILFDWERLVDEIFYKDGEQ